MNGRANTPRVDVGALRVSYWVMIDMITRLEIKSYWNLRKDSAA
jgi:hypothetical protein